jgi:hypothetical protein
MTIRRVIAALVTVAVLGGVGAVVLDSVVDGDLDGTQVQADGATTGVAPGSTSPRAVRALPDEIPRDGDDECFTPRTDPDRPAIPPAGEPTDGVEVSQVVVADRGAGEVTFTATVSHRPVVSAASGSRWVVIDLAGVRHVDPGNVRVESDHARAEPAVVCDDSAVAFAFAFDGLVTGLELLTHDDTTVEVLVRTS